MSNDWLLEPLDSEAPCGPDLAAVDDEAFADYFYGAEARMPERYVVPGMQGVGDAAAVDRVFDPRSVDHKAEKTAIEALLRRSRDLRLLSLLARFQCLAGRLGGMAEAIRAMADLLDAFPADVHPAIHNGTADRRAALEDLANNVTIVFPLQHLNLVPDGQVTYRRYLVATGQAEPRQGEGDLNSSDMISALGSPASKDQVSATHALLSQIAGDLGRIERSCQANPERPFNPSLDRAKAVVADIQAFIQMGRADLVPFAEDADSAAQTADADPVAEDTAAPAPVAPTPTGEGIAVASQPAARAALEAVERYFASHEPASAALLLVTQARLLIGKPLVEALETLLPAHANRAVIDFGPEMGFALPMERLKALSSAIPASNAETETPPPSATVDSRADAARSILGVEEYFRRKEPASPIPMLLLRARSYLDKDFNALVKELIPAKPSEA